MKNQNKSRPELDATNYIFKIQVISCKITSKKEICGTK